MSAMDTTATVQPRMFRNIVPPLTPGVITTLAPIESEFGREHCLDVRLGVGIDPTLAGYALSVEDDPVVLIIINAMAPYQEWEPAVRALSFHHRRAPKPLLGITDDGVTSWQTSLGIPERWTA